MVPARYHGKARKKERKKGGCFKKDGMPTPVGVSFFLDKPPTVEEKIHYITCPPIRLPKLKQVYRLL
jgi:hypothetical protein